MISETLNFSWLIEGEIAGSAAPMSEEELAYLSSQGIGAIVRLAEPETDDFVIAHDRVLAAGLQDLQIPVEDFHAPSLVQIEQAIDFIQKQLARGRPVAVSCGAGCGRTGTILACYLVSKGESADDALRAVIDARPCSDEIVTQTPAQKRVIEEFERSLKAGVQA